MKAGCGTVGVATLVAFTVGMTVFAGGGDGAPASGQGTTQASSGPAGDVKCGVNGTVTLAGFEPDQMKNAATIITTGKQLGASTQDLVVAIITAMQESTLWNLDHGDRDSLGLFQQRPSMDWGTPAQIMDPVFATTSFFKGRGSNKGLLDIPGRAFMAPTVAAQAVQRSGTPTAYAQHVPKAQAIVQKITGQTACTQGSPVFAAGPALNVTMPRANPRSTADAVAYAKSRLGTEYPPSRCLSWVATVYGWNYSGRNYAIDQWNTTPASMRHPGDENPPPGAVVFYWTKSAAKHIAVSIGGGQVITTDSPRGHIGQRSLQDLKSWGPYIGWAVPYFPVAG